MTSDPPALRLRALPLADIPGVAWKLLSNGATAARDPLHTPSLATLSEDGPHQRTVVLRHVDATLRLIACHTDLRSPKVQQAREAPSGSWLFYDPRRKLQLRLEGRLTVHTDDALANSCWADSRPMSRACYNTVSGPGTPVPEPPTAPLKTTDAETEREARSHFAVLACSVSEFDWLCLDAAGHRRAQFQWQSEQWRGAWVTP